jgi:NUMOD3 motif
MYYVYEHWRPDRDEPFYVGKGKGSRANTMKGRNRHHLAIQAKLHRLGMAVEVRIIECNLTEENAFELEKQRIALWVSNGIDLANLTLGGEGSSGHIGPRGENHHMFGKPSPMRGKKLSDEAKIKISNAQKGRKNRLGAILSEETKKKISDSCKGKESPLRGIKKSEEVKAKISLSVSKAICGEKNPFYGKKHSEETKAKISEAVRAKKCTAP